MKKTNLKRWTPRVIIIFVLVFAGFLFIRHTYRQSPYNYIGTKEVRFEAKVVDDSSASGKVYNLSAIVQYDDCASDLKAIGLGCTAAISVRKIYWPGGGYLAFSDCSFRHFNAMFDCQATNDPRSFTISVINKKLSD